MAWQGLGGNNNTAGIYFTNYFAIQISSQNFQFFRRHEVVYKESVDSSVICKRTSSIMPLLLEVDLHMLNPGRQSQLYHS